jgi:hypothetical protein
VGVGIGIGLRVKGPRGRKVGDGVGLLGGDDAGRVMAVLLFYPSRRVQKSGCEVGGQVVAEARCFVDNLDGVLWPLMGTERVI